VYRLDEATYPEGEAASRVSCVAEVELEDLN
jgi:hypothetical protein